MTESADNLVAVIMAGGAGERFWPYSRKERPKQLLRLGAEKPMLVETIDRVSPVIPRDRVLIVAGEHLRRPILDCLGPDFPEENLVVEPIPKNTAACLALAAVVMGKRFGNATMAVLTADHVIRPEAIFVSQVRLACRVAQETGSLVTFGIPPTRPDTGFGYIEAGEQMKKLGGRVREVKQFREKPDTQTARTFVDAGNFYWNSGMFFWTRDAITEAFRQHQPAFHKGMERIADAYGTEQYRDVLREVFEAYEKKPIDTAILEKAGNRLMVEAEFIWDDIGSWTSLGRLRDADDQGNVVLADSINHDSHNTIVFQVPESAKRPLIATLGVDDLIIVVSDDVVMVADRKRPQDVKKLLHKVRDAGRTDVT